MSGIAIQVAGLVQGVGFRPFVWRLARDADLSGTVWNDASGVRIEAWGDASALESFAARLRAELPPLARIDRFETAPLDGNGPHGFTISASRDGTRSAGIVPDAATCAECLAEIADPASRRYGYAFTNCTHCGPRLSIVEAIPYDRANTTMRAFTMCTECAAEYHDPADRRFHAQPNACPRCGPRLWIEDESGPLITETPLLAAAAALKEGAIVAIKGIGGFHLACDAADAPAVTRLRARKHRDAKPFAIMARPEDLPTFARVDAATVALLRAPAAPIVVVPAIRGAPPDGIAPGQDRVGVMLPYTALHHLLLDAFGGALVMTSGNRSEEPQATDNDAARRDLAGIADLWLLHDRAIVNRLDDSVVVADPGGPIVLRRARGHAPAPLPLGPGFADAPPVLAMGGNLKSTFCLLQHGHAVVSHHIGDLAEARTHGDYRAAIRLYREIYDFTPAIVAVDLHAGYHATRWGEQIAEECGARLVRVQHHHAHLAACLAEHGFGAAAPPVLGWMLDGLGMGADGALWGGELLRADFHDCERVAHLPAMAMPGGNAASREPWRNLVAQLRAAFGPDWRDAAAALGDVFPDPRSVQLVERLIDTNTNAPPASSTGRLFDAVAAALGLSRQRLSFEGEAAMRLEAVARGHADERPYALSAGFDLVGLWRAILADIRSETATGRIAARFHLTLAEMIAGQTPDTREIALSGGVLQNSLFATALCKHFEARGVRLLRPRVFPANDGGISLGQAAIAAAGSFASVAKGQDDGHPDGSPARPAPC